MERATTIPVLAMAAALLSPGCGGGDAAAPAETGEGLALEADEGCAVLSCPNAERDCCTEVLATAAGASDVNYARRDDVIQAFDQSSEAVRAEFAFDAADQSGRIVFNLGRNLSIYRLRLIATITGAVDTDVGVTLSDATSRGCVFGFSIADGAPITGSMALNHSAELTSDEYCFSGGVPGAGSVLEIASYSTSAGAGILEIESIDLLALGVLE